MPSIEQLEKQASKRWDKRVKKAKKSIGKKTKKSRKGHWSTESDKLWNVGAGSPSMWQWY